MRDNDSEEEFDNKVFSKLMSFDEYMQVKHTVPYCYKLGTPARALYFYGCKHFTSIQDPQYQGICDQLASFQPKTIAVEMTEELIPGAPADERSRLLDQVSTMNHTEALSLSERVLGIKLALERGISVICPEPSFLSQCKQMEDSGYPPREIFTYFMFRSIAAYPLYSKKFTFEEFLEWRFAKLNSNSPWPNKFSLSNITDSTEAVLGITGLQAPAWYDMKVSPMISHDHESYCLFNELSQLNSRIRDEHILRVITTEVNCSERLFVLYGASHAYMLQPALEVIMM